MEGRGPDLRGVAYGGGQSEALLSAKHGLGEAEPGLLTLKEEEVKEAVLGRDQSLRGGAMA